MSLNEFSVGFSGCIPGNAAISGNVSERENFGRKVFFSLALGRCRLDYGERLSVGV